jgi:hypothetical protein
MADTMLPKTLISSSVFIAAASPADFPAGSVGFPNAFEPRDANIARIARLH